MAGPRNGGGGAAPPPIRRGAGRRLGRAFVASLSVVGVVLGVGLSSAGTAGATLFTFKPTAPTLTEVHAGDSGVQLGWTYGELTPFTVSGPSSTTRFGVCWSTLSAPTSCTSPQATFTSHSAQRATGNFTGTVGGLQNGLKYYFVVVAHNSYGYSGVSNWESGTPGRPPSTPFFSLKDASSPLQGAFILDWSAPTDGGFPITKYFVCWSSTAALTYTCNTPTITATHETIYATLVTQTHAYESVEVGGLTLGMAYAFEVVAVTQFGESEGVTDLQFAIPSTAPSAPVLETAAPGDGQVSLRWRNTGTNGAYATSVRICWSPALPVTCGLTNELALPSAPTVTTGTVTGLANGKTEYFTVSVGNADGYSPPSNAVSATPSSVPATVAFQATHGDRSVTLSWTAPFDGGSPITAYGICWSATEGGAYTECRFHTPQETVAPTVTTYTVSPLANGTTYSFAVIAENANGHGSPSFTFTFATPSTVPSRPVIASAIPVSSGDVALRWQAPTDGGSTISYYWICWTHGPAPTACPTTGPTVRQVGGGGTTNDLTLTGLQLGEPYYFVVTAQNADGYSPASLPTPPVVPSSLPTPPVLLPPVTGSSTVTISWAAPANDGGSAITGYGLCWGVTSGASYETPCEAGTEQWSVLGQTTRSDTLSGLVNGTRYWYSLVALNANGQSGPTSGSATPSTLPTPPVLKSAAGGTGAVTLHWTPPTATGGLPIDGYGICFSTGSAPTSCTPASPGAGPTAVGGRVGGLTNGTTYTFVVSTETANGYSGVSNALSATPSTVPTPPYAKGTAGDHAVTLTWTAPADGGSPITGYTVCWSETDLKTVMDCSGTATLVTHASLGASTTTYTVTGLAYGVTYYFEVLAHNVDGASASHGTVTETLYAAPTAPVLLSVVAGDQSATLTWTPSATQGGTGATTGYAVCWSETAPPATCPYTESTPGLNTSTAGGDAVGDTTQDTVHALVNGATYYFVVDAYNRVGSSPVSSALSAVPSAVPAQPTLTATPGDGSVTLNWTSPTDGGSPITAYLVCWSATQTPDTLLGGCRTGTSQASVSPSTTTYTVSPLVNGRTYYFALEALNVDGSSPVSVTVSATPSTVPGPPTVTSLVSGYTTLATIAWNPPATDGGLQVTSYLVCWSAGAPPSSCQFAAGEQVPPGEEVLTALPRPLTVVVTKGETYFFVVRAGNADGYGPASSPVSTTPGVPETAPVLTSATPGDATATLRWTQPATPGVGRGGGTGLEISGYGICWSTTSAPAGCATPQLTVSGFRATTATVTGLANGTTYYFVVVAENSYGASPPSDSLDALVGRPSAPTLLYATSRNGSVGLTWAPATKTTGGGPVTSYGICWTMGSAAPISCTSPQTVVPLPRTTLSVFVFNLTNGTYYSFVVVAHNAYGYSPVSNAIMIAPGAPTPVQNTSAVPNGSGAIALTWSKPQSNGSTITRYGVCWTTVFSFTFHCTTPQLWVTGATTLGATVKGLTNGVSYTFAVVAENARGISPTVYPAIATPTTVPGAPTLESAAYGNGSVALTWKAPSTDGYSAITGYRVCWGTSAPAACTATSSPGGTAGPSATSYTVDGLTNGTAYSFVVVAENSNGAGTLSNVLGATPSTVPAAPAITPLAHRNRGVVVAWTDSTDGGATLTAYRICWGTSAPPTACTSTSATQVTTGRAVSTWLVGTLTNGTTYYFVVVAENQNGSSPLSAPQSATPSTVPAAPVIVSAVPGSGSMTITWQATTDGGSPITGYQVRCLTTPALNCPTKTVGPTVSSYTAYGLKHGILSALTVVAENANGSSASADVYFTPTTPPAAPTLEPVTYGRGSAALTWKAPSTNGGSSITGYGICWSATGTAPSSCTAPQQTATGTSATVTTLHNGTAYTFVVVAENAYGYSGVSNARSVTPSTVPSAPTLGPVSHGNGSAALTWTAPSTDGGSPITHYGICWTTTGTPPSSCNTPQKTATGTSATVTTLHNGTAYTFVVVAENQNGSSAVSNPETVVPSTVPTAPSLTPAAHGNGSTSLAWSTPTDGGTPITDYGICWTTAGTAPSSCTTPQQTATTTSATVTTLHNGTAYTFVVVAENQNGSSAVSNAETVVPSTVSTAPQLTAAHGNGSVVLSWTEPGDGGAAISGYGVCYWNNPTISSCSYADLTVTGASTLTTTVTGFANGYPFNFDVFAVNLNGKSAVSNVVTVTPSTVPAAPTVSATKGDTSVALSWPAPTDGGTPITGYRVCWGTSAVGACNLTRRTRATLSKGTQSYDVTGLANGTAYTFEVVALNLNGTSVSGSATATPSTVPAAPAVTASHGDGSVTLSWAAPTDGGTPITGYLICWGTAAPSTCKNWPTALTATVGPGTSSYKVTTNLRNGSTAFFRVTAWNLDGTSAPTVVTATPSTVPSQPSATAVHGDDAVTLNWAPLTDGGAPISGYRICWGASAPATCAQTTATAATPGAGTRSYTVTGLTNGVSYTFDVVALNLNGGSSPAVLTATPSTVPVAPTLVSVVPSAYSATLTWTKPTDGGAAISSYGICWSTSGVPACTSTMIQVTGATTLSGTVSDLLSNGKTYDFVVVAANLNGSSRPSNAVAGTPSTVPSPVHLHQTAHGNRTLTVSWTAPTDGGATITGYRVCWSLATQGAPACTTPTALLSTTTTSYTIGGLTNGSTYDVVVIAVNKNGPAAASEVTGVPSTVPVAPVFNSAVVGTGAVTITFSPTATDGGSAISHYGLCWSTGAAPSCSTPTVWVTDGQRVYLGLSTRARYYFVVVAGNANGYSPPSNAIESASTPAAPAISSATRGVGTVTLAWTAPTNGGSPITAYQVCAGSTPYTTLICATVGLTLSDVVTFPGPGLTTTYGDYFGVVAENAQGSSPVSPYVGPLSPLAPAPPPPPPGSTTVATASSATSTGTAVASTPSAGLTASATGVGSLTVAKYPADPTTVAVSGATGTYLDVRVAQGSTFSSLTIKVCSGNGSALEWWNGSTWLPITGATVEPTGCITATLTPTTTPSISAFTGTPIAVVSLQGYWTLGAGGAVSGFGTAHTYPATRPVGHPFPPPGQAVAMAPTPDGKGYWVVSANGTVEAFGDASSYCQGGTCSSLTPPRPGGPGQFEPSVPPGPPGAVVDIAANPVAPYGYWLVTTGGAVYALSGAPALGTLGSTDGHGHRPSPDAQPVVGIAAAPAGSGYWLVSASGTVEPFGDATSYCQGGTCASLGPSRPGPDDEVVGIAADPLAPYGYWLVTEGGKVTGLSGAPTEGSVPAPAPPQPPKPERPPAPPIPAPPPPGPIVGIAASAAGGYVVVSANGDVYAFGNAKSFGNVPRTPPLGLPVVGIASLPL